MILIDEYNGIKFYDGIDFKYANEYRGSDIIVFMIINWENELLKQKRNSLLEKIINNVDNDNEYNNIDNFRVIIYQTNGFLNETINLVKEKMKREFIGSYNYLAVNGSINCFMK